MTQGVWSTLLFFLTAAAALAQEVQDYQVYTEPPRLLMTARRLKLLTREKERQSLRWMQFETLMAGKARMAEPAFASALYSLVTGQPEGCRAASDWTNAGAKMDSPAHVRQVALVLDWCGSRLPPNQTAGLSRRLAGAARQPARGIAAVRSRLFAALAIADNEAKLAETVVKETAETWWKREMLPQLKKSTQPITGREELYALMEILHVFRDNLRIELKDDAVTFFEYLPPIQLLSYYPLPWPAAENEYRIPMYTGTQDPSLEEAAFSRAAELALVAYDGNPQSVQFLQGWLMQDRFLMRGSFGIPYEFLWGNPYLPGLSYQYMPDLFHNRGNLLIRATWDEDSAWFGYSNGMIQYFNEGKRVSVNPKSVIAPINVGDVTVHFWRDDLRFDAGVLAIPTEDDEKKTNIELAFIVGATPGLAYNVEVDGEEMFEERADEGGIIALKFLRGRTAGVRINPAVIPATVLRSNP